MLYLCVAFVCCVHVVSVLCAVCVLHWCAGLYAVLLCETHIQKSGHNAVNPRTKQSSNLSLPPTQNAPLSNSTGEVHSSPGSGKDGVTGRLNNPNT